MASSRYYHSDRLSYSRAYHPPQKLTSCNVQSVPQIALLWANDAQLCLFPSIFEDSSLPCAAPVACGVIQNDHSLLADAKREVLHKFDEPVGVYVLLGGETMIDTIAVNHSEDIESSAFIYGHTEILIFKFPCIRHIPFGAYMAFITVIQVNETRLPLMFKLLQEFLLISVLLR